MNWVCAICFICFPAFMVGAGKKSLYADFRKLYSNYEENDGRAFAILNPSISKAKELQDFHHLVYAYEDAAYYSSLSSDKLKYADSALAASIKSAKPALISRSYLGKGIIFYFNFKNYSAALSQYLEAYKWSQKSNDVYLKYKIKYHIGVVKNYLGYYEESINHFNDCQNFFENKLKQNLHPDEVFNHTRGLLNSMHQQTVAHLYLNNSSSAATLIKKGFFFIKNDADYDQEKGYFLKCFGILQFRDEAYGNAEKSLLEAIKLLKNKKDFASIAVAHYYLGKIKTKLNQQKQAANYFAKVDSTFTAHQFMLPEIRSAYDYQIRYAKIQKDKASELYNMNQLLKVDKILAADFPYLSSRMHREYDTANLIIDNKSLEKSNMLKTGLLTGGALHSLSIIGVLVRRNRNQKKINKNYEILIENLKNDKWVVNQESPVIHQRKNIYDHEIVDDILLKLQKFEKGTKFLEKGLTLRKLAFHLKTNGTHLSYVINEYKKMNFNVYLKTLRINHITKMMYSNSKFLNYTVESLAKECGISSRQVFSDQFYEINGLRPADFIHKRLKELKDLEEKKN